MPRFTLTIDCDNAAFDDDARPGVARILNDLSSDLQECSRSTGKLYDVNGNAVGVWKLTEGRR